MKKLYFIIPVVGVLIFLGYYLSFQKDLAQVEQEKKVAIESARKAKIDTEIKAREKAQKDAIELQAIRKREKAEREAKIAQNKAQLDDLRLEAEKFQREKDRIDANVRRTQKDIDELKSSVEKVETRRENLNKDQEHLRGLIKIAESNVRGLEAVLYKIEAAEKAQLAAATAAKTAQNKNK